MTNERLRTAVYRSGIPLLFPFRKGGFLRESGWVRSVFGMFPQGADGSPAPWLTESCIDFLSTHLTSDLIVGEYGSGNSTKWFAERCSHVTTVEHDKEWAERLRHDLPSNVELLVAVGGGPVSHPEDGYRTPSSYPSYASTLPFEGRQYDLVIIDGLDRVGCVEHTLSSAMLPKAILVDNTDARYEREMKPAVDLLKSEGYRRVDFHGAALGSWRKTCTSIFYTEGNFLEL